VHQVGTAAYQQATRTLIVTVPYAACIQLCPPENEHLMLKTCTRRTVVYE